MTDMQWFDPMGARELFNRIMVPKTVRDDPHPSTLPNMDEAARNPSINPCTDPNVESVIVRHRERARHGLAKYSTTTAREDLSLAQWLQHLQDELMDAAVYVERLKVEVAKLPEVAAKLVKP